MLQFESCPVLHHLSLVKGVLVNRKTQGKNYKLNQHQWQSSHKGYSEAKARPCAASLSTLRYTARTLGAGTVPLKWHFFRSSFKLKFYFLITPPKGHLRKLSVTWGVLPGHQLISPGMLVFSTTYRRNMTENKLTITAILNS